MADKKLFVVAAAYSAECCTTPHVWVTVLKAGSTDEAKESLFKKVTAKGYDCDLKVSVVAAPLSYLTERAKPKSAKKAVKKHA